MHAQVFRLAGPDIVFEDFDGDLVVLNLATGRYFGFDTAAAQLWEALAAGVATDRITQAMARPDDLAGFVEMLVANDLIAATEAEPAALDAGLADRIAGLTAAPVVSVFDDLADLIVADPIHDTVEEVGWPVRPT